MSRRNRRGKNKIFKRDTDTLSDRAVTTGLLYNYLSYVSPKDVDGLKRAYVDIDREDIEVRVPRKESIQELYGKRATLIPSETGPTALIPRYSPKDVQFNKLESFGSSLLRSALRKIVDEV
jgi:hypothetical protein